MSQPLLFTSVTWTVSRLTQHIRTLLESDATLQEVWVQGEVSNLSRPVSGHIYFTLKDSGASLRTVIWKSDAKRIKSLLQDGMEIEIHGRIGVYETQGQYQFYADVIRPIGEGQLYQEYLRLKAKLEAEGLFSLERKRSIPDFPHTIGIVTSATGAALRDILDTLQRRLPLVEVILATSLVQGTEAPAALVDALEALDRLRPDVMLLARGGGSMEDLWPFNDEHVVRAIAGLQTPVISGVGHETDFTLCDFAADLRAPTPTAAAELATPISILDIKGYLEAMRNRFSHAVLGLISTSRYDLEMIVARLKANSPWRSIQTGRQRLDDLAHLGVSAFQYALRINRTRLNGMERRLQALNPLSVLGRGYAIVTDMQDHTVSQIAQVQPGDGVKVQVSDGHFRAEVREDKEK